MNTTAFEMISDDVLANTTPSTIPLTLEDYIEYRISWKMYQVYVPICVLVGILGNSISFLVLVTSNLRYTSTCIYLAAISCLDTAILTVALCYHINRYPGTVVFHTWTCPLITFLFYFCIHFDTLLLLAMTAERYMVVRFPLQMATITRRRTLIIIAAIGLFSLAVNMHVFFTRGMEEIDGRNFCGYTGPTERMFVTKIYPWIDSTLYCFIPMSSLFVLNVLIIYHIKKAAVIQKNLTGAGSMNAAGRGGRLGENRGQKQVTTMLVLVSVAFLLLAGPIAIHIILQRYVLVPKTTYETALNNLAHAFTDNLMYTNHAINFILYMMSGQRFRRELHKLLFVRKKKYVSSGNPASTTLSSLNSETSDIPRSSGSNMTISVALEDKL